MSGTSRISLPVNRFEWGIRKSKLSKKGLRYALTSPNFSFTESPFPVGFPHPDNIESSWYLQFDSKRGDPFGWYGLYLFPDYSNYDFDEDGNPNIKVKVGVIMKDGTEGNVKRCQTLSRDSFGFPEFIQVSLCCSETDELFRDDKLTIFCDLETGTKMFDIQTRIIHSRKYADFTFVFGEQQEFPVHRAVLASNSSVFDAMFQQDTKEKRSGRLEIKDVDRVGMLGLVQFIYLGKVKDLEEIAVQVLAAAEKYGVDELKTMCKKVICKKNSENGNNVGKEGRVNIFPARR